jgi:hypothetical protein
MSIEPIYRIAFAPEVRPFIRRLVKQDRAVVFHELRLIAARLIDPERVDYYGEKPKTYYVDARGLSPHWPDGLRIFFRVSRRVMMVTVIDIGDHRTCATHPSQSIYPDER